MIKEINQEYSKPTQEVYEELYTLGRGLQVIN